MVNTLNANQVYSIKLDRVANNSHYPDGSLAPYTLSISLDLLSGGQPIIARQKQSYAFAPGETRSIANGNPFAFAVTIPAGYPAATFVAKLLDANNITLDQAALDVAIAPVQLSLSLGTPQRPGTNNWMLLWKNVGGDAWRQSNLASSSAPIVVSPDSPDFLITIYEFIGAFTNQAEFGPYLVTVPSLAGDYTLASLVKTSLLNQPCQVTGRFTAFSNDPSGIAGVFIIDEAADEPGSYFVGATVPVRLEGSPPVDRSGKVHVDLNRPIVISATLRRDTSVWKWYATILNYPTALPDAAYEIYGQLTPVLVPGHAEYIDGEWLAFNPYFRYDWSVYGGVGQFKVAYVLPYLTYPDDYSLYDLIGPGSGEGYGRIYPDSGIPTPRLFVNPDLNAVWNPFTWKIENWKEL